jgi:hypothetical protein
MARNSLGFRVTGNSSPHDRALAGSTALHAQYGKGNETSNQIAAQEANLELANAARLRGSVTNINKVPKGQGVRHGHGSIKLPKTGYYQSATSRGRKYGRRFQDGAYLAGLHPRGDRMIAYVAKKAPKARKVTGRNVRFIKEIGPGNFSTRTSWGRTRNSSGFIKELKPRQKRLAHQKNWTHRGHMWIPR